MKYECFGENMKFYVTDDNGRRRLDPKMKALFTPDGSIHIWDLEAYNRPPINKKDKE